MIRIAVIGFGWWGQQITRRLAGSQRLHVAMVVDPLESQTAIAGDLGIATAPHIDAALADATIDAVVLATPHSLHEAQICAAAAAGKHVFCEKPLGLSRASAERSLAACRRAGVVLGVGHERRFEAAMIDLRRRIAEGEFGTVMHAAADFSHDKIAGLAKDNWRLSPDEGPSAAMTGTGVHLTDLFIATFGRVADVAAFTADRLLGWPNGEVISVQLAFEAGMTATVSGVLKTPFFSRYHVFGSQAWAEIRNAAHPDTPGPAELTILRAGASEAERHLFDWNDAVRDNLEAFAAAVMGDAPYPFSDEELVHNVEVLEAVGRSARGREVVHLVPEAARSSAAAG